MFGWLDNPFIYMDYPPLRFWNWGGQRWKKKVKVSIQILMQRYAQLKILGYILFIPCIGPRLETRDEQEELWGQRESQIGGLWDSRCYFSGTPPVSNRSSPSWHKDGVKLQWCILSSWIEVFLDKVDSQTSILLGQPCPIYLWSCIDYLMPGLCRILTLGQIWQLIVNPDPDKNLHTKSVHSKYFCRIIFLILLVINKSKDGLYFGFDLRTPFCRFLGVLVWPLTDSWMVAANRKTEKEQWTTANSQPLDMIFQINWNIVLKIYNSPTNQKYFSFKVESKKKKRLPRKSSSVQFASKEMAANNSSAGWGLFWLWLFCKEDKRLGNRRK